MKICQITIGQINNSSKKIGLQINVLPNSRFIELKKGQGRQQFQIEQWRSVRGQPNKFTIKQLNSLRELYKQTNQMLTLGVLLH